MIHPTALQNEYEMSCYNLDEADILEQRQRPVKEPGALHLTRQCDLLELDLPEPDLSLYNRGGEQ